jgi:hypothetical protein
MIKIYLIKKNEKTHKNIYPLSSPFAISPDSVRVIAYELIIFFHLSLKRLATCVRLAHWVVGFYLNAPILLSWKVTSFNFAFNSIIIFFLLSYIFLCQVLVVIMASTLTQQKRKGRYYRDRIRKISSEWG